MIRWKLIQSSFILLSDINSKAGWLASREKPQKKKKSWLFDDKALKTESNNEEGAIEISSDLALRSCVAEALAYGRTNATISCNL